jgi:septum site-determining protein MinD
MLAITGGKGGTGKTTTALGLASVLADRRRDPIVVDGDVDMPNLHIRAGTPDSGLDQLASGATVDAAAAESDEYPGVDVVGATPGAALDAALRSIVTDRPVIVDGAAGASERAVTPLRHADSAVVVTRDTPASVTDTVKTVRMARAVGTPVSAGVVSRVSHVSDTLASQVPVDSLVAVPAVERPVTQKAARAAYSQIVDRWINA